MGACYCLSYINTSAELSNAILSTARLIPGGIDSIWYAHHILYNKHVIPYATATDAATDVLLSHNSQ